ncbi:MAG: hypothetical protein Q8N51_07680, partial [Gammaproteobacteria bacterium]|nr:hypothetical protein [Gammaproteobacteria bacterium]
MPDPNHTLLEITDADLRDLLRNMAVAESAAIPGVARQCLVIGQAVTRKSQSPPPVWIWLLVIALEKGIPLLLEWLKKHYGEEWP